MSEQAIIIMITIIMTSKKKDGKVKKKTGFDKEMMILF